MTPSMLIERAIYLGDFTILFETTEGEVRIINFNDFLKRNLGEFESMRIEEVFKKFYLHTYILTWDIDIPKRSENQINQFDIAPEYIYENSKPVEIKLEDYIIKASA